MVIAEKTTENLGFEKLIFLHYIFAAFEKNTRLSRTIKVTSLLLLGRLCNMGQKDTIIGLLQKNGAMTQANIAESIYGDRNHDPYIYPALMGLVKAGTVNRTGSHPAYYSLSGTKQIIPIKVTAPKEKHDVAVVVDDAIIEEISSTIAAVSSLLGHDIPSGKIMVIDRGIPHTPRSLRSGTMGVYTFLYNGRFIKIGKAGPNSNARFFSQHYTPGSAQSTLSASILADEDMRGMGITEQNVGSWIKQNCRRIDVIIDSDLGIFTLELIEAVLHYKYEPKYEGFKNQR